MLRITNIEYTNTNGVRSFRPRMGKIHAKVSPIQCTRETAGDPFCKCQYKRTANALDCFQSIVSSAPSERKRS